MTEDLKIVVYYTYQALDEISKVYVLFKKGGYAMFAYDDGTKPKFWFQAIGSLSLMQKLIKMTITTLRTCKD